jgi:aminoglycoside phosphotransferase (APT) family kinase protein
MDAAVLSDLIGGLELAAGGAARVTSVKRVRGGNSSEIWAFDGHVTRDGEEHVVPLILRCGADNEFALGGRGIEASVLGLLGARGYPVPKIYWFDAEGVRFGRQAMLMERSPGSADRLILTDRNAAGLSVDQRVAAAKEIVGLLGRLHRENVPAELEAFKPAGNPAAVQLARHEAAFHKLEAGLEPMVEMHVAAWWLACNLPSEPERMTLVHGDFRPANMLVDNGAVSAVLDWEFAGVGDPIEDLGWYLTPFYSAEHIIPGHFEEADAIAVYEAASGIRVEHARLRFWKVFAMFKLAYMTVAALRWMVDGDASRMAANGSFMLRPLLAALEEPQEVPA